MEQTNELNSQIAGAETPASDGDVVAPAPAPAAAPRRHVRGFVESMMLPRDLDELLLEANEAGEERNRFDIEIVLSGEVGSGLAPQWAQPGDVVFYALAKKSSYTMRCLKRDWKAKRDRYSPAERNIIDAMLVKGQWLQESFGGRIVSACRVAEAPSLAGLGPDDAASVAIDENAVLENPITLDGLRRFLHTETSTSLTPVTGGRFDSLRRALVEADNTLPPFLRDAQALPAFCADIDAATWLDVPAEQLGTLTLVDELRSCYLDFLLESISDGPLYKSCRCIRGGSSKSGFVDYLVMLEGRYLPVLASLDVGAEADVAGRCAQYCGVKRAYLAEDKTAAKGDELYRHSVVIVDAKAAYIYDDRYERSEDEPADTPEGLHRFLELADCGGLDVEDVRSAFLDEIC